MLFDEAADADATDTTHAAGARAALGEAAKELVSRLLQAERG